MQEADEVKKSKKRKRKSEAASAPEAEKSERIRIEHLNYKVSDIHQYQLLFSFCRELIQA